MNWNGYQNGARDHVPVFSDGVAEMAHMYMCLSKEEDGRIEGRFASVLLLRGLQLMQNCVRDCHKSNH